MTLDLDLLPDMRLEFVPQLVTLLLTELLTPTRHMTRDPDA